MIRFLTYSADFYVRAYYQESRGRGLGWRVANACERRLGSLMIKFLGMVP